ncbi:MAG: hypothetical protein AAB152_17580 [Candidatus Coatesbacteria bacterium]
MVDRMEWGREPVLSRDGAGAVDDKRLEALQRRVDKLETENRRWGIIAALVIAGMSLGVFIVGRASRPVDSVRTRSILLADKDGVVRASLGLGEGDQPVLAFMDRSQRVRLTVGLTPAEQPQMTLAGTNEKSRIRFLLPTDNTVSIVVADRDGVDRAWLGLDRAGMSGLTLYGPEGRMEAALSTVGGSLAGLSFFGRRGRERAAFGISGETGLLRLIGGPGESSVLLQVGSDGLPGLNLFDKDRGARIVMTVGLDGTPTLTLRDKKGAAAVVSNGRLLLGKDQTVLWSAP